MFEEVFQFKTMNPDRLSVFGFTQEKKHWKYETDIMDGSFDLTVFIQDDGSVDTRLIEVENGEEYVLYKTNASGTFVGDIRTAIESVLTDIAASCYELAIFQQEQTQKLIAHVRETYGDELEFLWKKFPDNAVWRRKDKKKWYAALLTVQRCKLGLNSEEKVEIIDLRADPTDMEKLLEQNGYYPGWHMNKKHWYTIILDGSVPDKEIFERIRVSYELAKK